MSSQDETVSSVTQASIINKDRHEQAKLMQEQLERLGIMTRIQHFTGDSSYPTEYQLTYQNITAIGPTMDMAVAKFIERLLKSREQADNTPRSGECVECGRPSSRLTENGYCEGCVMQAAIAAMSDQ